MIIFTFTYSHLNFSKGEKFFTQSKIDTIVEKLEEKGLTFDYV